MKGKEGDDWSRVSRIYAAIDESRLNSVFPFILDQIKALNVQTLLDYGCGDGLFGRHAINDEVVKRCTNFDISSEMVAMSRKKCEHLPITTTSCMSQVETGSVDVVTAIAVWMCLNSEDECRTMLFDVQRVLSPGGHFFAAVTHPCFRSHEFSTFRTNFDLNDYLSSATAFQVTIHDERQSITVEDTHWNIDDMSRQLESAGFVIQRVFEKGDKKCPRGAAWMILHARRLPLESPSG